MPPFRLEHNYSVSRFMFLLSNHDYNQVMSRSVTHLLELGQVEVSGSNKKNKKTKKTCTQVMSILVQF